LPNHKPAWYDVISHTDLPAIQDICREVLKLYTHQKPDADKLEQIVSVLKKAQVEAKARLRGALGNARLRGALGNGTPTQTTNSRPATPSKVSPHSGAEDQKLKGDLMING